MADHVSPEGAALSLLHLIAHSERKALGPGNGPVANAPNREWILWTYAQCLETVRTPKLVEDTLHWPIPDRPPSP